MKRVHKIRIIPRWRPDARFSITLRRTIPVARRVEEFMPSAYYPLEEEEAWRMPAPLQ